MKGQHVISKGECQVYKAAINTDSPPPLSKNFLDDVERLLLPPNSDDSYYEFIEKYGTHFVESMTMGSKISLVKSVTGTKGQTYGDSKLTLTAAASYSGSEEDFYADYKIIKGRTPTYGYGRGGDGVVYYEKEFASWAARTERIQARINNGDPDNNGTIAAIRVRMSGQDPNENNYDSWFGGAFNDNQYDASDFVIPEGQRVAMVKVWVGDGTGTMDRVNGLLFITDKGYSSPMYGIRSGAEFYTVQIDGVLSGFHGHVRIGDSDNRMLNSLGFCSFLYSTPDEPKITAKATPLYGQRQSDYDLSEMKGKWFQVSNLTAKVELFFMSCGSVMGVGIRIDGEERDEWKFGAWGLGCSIVSQPDFMNFDTMFIFDNSHVNHPEVDFVRSIIFAKDGPDSDASLQWMIGVNDRGKPPSTLYRSDYGTISGIYGRAYTHPTDGYLHSIGFIFAHNN